MTTSDGTVSGGAIVAIPIVCTLSDATRTARRHSIERLFTEAEQVAELDDGYALRFSAGAAPVTRLVDMILAERECCLFFTFALTFSPNQGPVWLHVRGPEGVKAFIQDLMQA